MIARTLSQLAERFATTWQLRSRTCEVRKLIQRMDILPELVIDLQASSA
jgi:hypothetical protein